jgi:hypothetical protein
MSQISRPFQIALLTMGLFVAVWFVGLRGHSSATSGGGSPAPAPATASAPRSSADAQGEKPAAPSSAYQGSAPGVAGLTRAITKAHGAVAQSQQNERQLKEKSAQASSPASTVGSSAEATASSKASVAPTSSATTAPKVSLTTTRHRTLAGKPGTPSRKVPARQVLVEHALKQGGVAIVLFWSSKGSDDVAVHRELLKAVGLQGGRRVAVQEAPASQVASFGSITRSVRVTGTPTLLIINKHGRTTTLTGLTDAYSIDQAIDEARKT